MTPQERKERRADLRFQRMYSAYQSHTNETLRLYREVSEGKHTYQSYMDEYGRLVERINKDKRLNMYYRNKLDGMRDIMFEQLYRNVLIWTHVVNGVRVDSRSLDGRNDVDWTEISQTGDSDHAIKLANGEWILWR